MFVVLRGTGMVFDVAILQRYPWTSFSVVEDSEYSYKLVRAGYRIWFVDNVNVTSEFPENRSQLDTQRRRWFGGGVELAASQSWNLLKTGLTALDWRLVDAAINSWIVARPLIILQLSVSIVAAIIYCLVASDQTLASVFLVSLVAVIAGYLTYVAVGLLCVGLSAHRLSLLLKTPWFVAYYLCISANALARGASKEWVSTPRQAKTSDVQPRASR
jgi:cellulose synthase/poly-beta-1,6-N-acetylglucosamine synthase-like glycosyltransferase